MATNSIHRLHKSETSYLADAVRNCLVRNEPSTRLISNGGGNLNWLIDLRPLFLDPEALQNLANEFWTRFATKLPFQVGAMETAAIPLLAAILLEARKRGLKTTGFIIRKERKKTGLGKWIEGKLIHAPVVMLDDTINSGNSLDIARQALATAGRKIRDVFVVIDYESGSGKAWRERTQIAVHSLFKLREFGLGISSAGAARPDFTNRDPAWEFHTTDGSPFHMVPKSTPLLVNGKLYMGSDQGRFRCINANDGAEIWCFQALGNLVSKGIWSSPCHHAGRIYFGAYNGNVYCLDAATGAEVWCQSLCEWVGSSPVVAPCHNAVVIGLEYERPGAGGSMVALSLDTGEKIWEYGLKVYQHGSAAYWPEQDMLICGTNDHNVIALDAATGREVWLFPTRRSVKYAPAIDPVRGLVAFASYDKSIYILNARTGEKLFEIETDNLCYTTPLFVDNHLFCGSGDRHMYVIDLDTMTAVKRIHVHARVYSSPRLIGDKIIFGTCGGLVCEVGRESLKIERAWRVADAITSAVIGTEDASRIFVQTYMNELFAFDQSP